MFRKVLGLLVACFVIAGCVTQGPLMNAPVRIPEYNRSPEANLLRVLAEVDEDSSKAGDPEFVDNVFLPAHEAAVPGLLSHPQEGGEQ
jgi:hypothetical protein